MTSIRLRHRRWFSAAALGLALLVSPPVGASSARELVRMARAHEAAREEDLAVRRYMDALALDPTLEDAYLGLGSLRARRGDVREADRVYTVALEHVPHSRAARMARAYVRRAMGDTHEAIVDLLTGVDQDDRATLKILAGWYAEDGLAPAALAVWRRIAVRASLADDAVALHEARVAVRALSIVVGPADPAAAPPPDAGAVRALVASIARRGGA